MDDKTALRARIRAARRAMDPAARRDADAAIGRRLMALVAATGARAVAAYLSSPAEPGTRTFLSAAIAAGVDVLVPISCDDGSLDWVRAADAGPERMTALGVPEPDGARLGSAAIEGVDLVVAPAAAVDATGMRLGWGRGYYDRALSRVAPGVGVHAVLYDSEVVAHVPREPHDMPVSGAVTPTRTLSFDA